ncbi:MAG: hypothetical protein ABI792_06945, partial [bacterium]
HLTESGYLNIKRKEQLNKKIVELVNSKLKINFWNESKIKSLNERIDHMLLKEEDPYTYVEAILK